MQSLKTKIAVVFQSVDKINNNVELTVTLSYHIIGTNKISYSQ